MKINISSLKEIKLAHYLINTFRRFVHNAINS
jgi:hypothetical protein